MELSNVKRSFGSFHSSNIDEQLKYCESESYQEPSFVVDLPCFEEYKTKKPVFGKEIKKKHFLLDEDFTFLNHGAFGSVLKESLQVCQQVQSYVEKQPVRFVDRELFPQIVFAQKRMAKFVGCKASDIVFIENATIGTNTILNSLKLNESSVIYHLNTIYGAVRKSLREICKKTNAQTHEEKLSFPLKSKQDILSLVRNTLKTGTAIALFDHIPSNMAFILPIKEIIEICHSRNVPVLIDGAHALGAIDLNFSDLNADYYITNTHKWFCNPKGCGVMYVKPSLQESVKGINVSHGHENGFHSDLTFTGLKDYSPYLATQATLNFWLSVGPCVIRSRITEVLFQAVQHLIKAWDSFSLAPFDMLGTMSCVALPEHFYKNQNVSYDNAEQIQNYLFESHKIEVPIKCIDSVLYVRVSVHVYNDIDDYVSLGDAILHMPNIWP